MEILLRIGPRSSGSPVDLARKNCLQAAFRLAKTGRFKDAEKVELAMVFADDYSRKCFSEERARIQINKLCASATLNGKFAQDPARGGLGPEQNPVARRR